MAINRRVIRKIKKMKEKEERMKLIDKYFEKNIDVEGNVIYSSFSNKLRQLRKIKGYSQEYMSKQLGLGPSTYSTYENSRYLPDVKTIVKLSDLFNVSIDYLLREQTEKEPLKRIPGDYQYSCSKRDMENMFIKYFESMGYQNIIIKNIDYNMVLKTTDYDNKVEIEPKLINSIVDFKAN